MSTPSPSHPIYGFGAFEVDSGSGELRKNGVRLKVQDQPFQILIKLLENPDRLVTREELRSILWPADTFVDFDNSLNMAMKRLREVLGDSPERPTFIETVPRHGYRFIAPLQKRGSNNHTEQVSDFIGKPGSVHSRRWWIAAGVLLSAVLVGLTGWQFRRGNGEPSFTELETLPLVGSSGKERSPDFSPDGGQIAFAYGPENPGIYTAVVGGDKPLRLTSDGSDCCPAWAPDGRQIAFVRNSDKGIAIYSVSALGGSERRLYAGPSNQFVRTVDWSPDGKFLAFTQTDADKTHSWIALLSLADFTTKRLTSPSTSDLDFAPAFSPDGLTVAFVRVSVTGVVSDLYVVSVVGGPPKRLTFDNRMILGKLSWTADSREIVFSSDRAGVHSLWRVSAAGGTPFALAIGPAGFPAISTKGKQLAYERWASNNSFWELDLKDETHAQTKPRNLIPQAGIRPQFSPDGRKIAFQSDRLGYLEIWTCDRDGSNCGQLTFLRGHASAPRWSPDGRYVAFEYRPKDHSEVFVVEVPGGAPRQIMTLPGSNNGGPNWSRDGQSIYFYSDRGGGRLQLWKVPFQGGPPVQLTKQGGVFGIESFDGRYLYYSKLDAQGIWRMPSTGGEEVQVFNRIGGLDWSSWALGRNGIYFLEDSRTRSQSVQFFDFSTHKISPIWALERPGRLGLSLSADGNSILYTQADFSQCNIMLVKNFY